MSMEPDDYEREAFFEGLYEELGPQWAADHAEELYKQHYAAAYEEAVEEFTSARLRSYYSAHPGIARNAFAMKQQAATLCSARSPASLILAVATTEITIQELIVRPIVHGLVHSEAMAYIIMEMMPWQVGNRGIKKLAFAILKEIANLDLATYQRQAATVALWSEWERIRVARNRLIHKGDSPTDEDVALSADVASEFLEVLFPRVVTAVGLTVKPDFTIVA